MIVPFVQNLIHHVVERDDKQIIKLYALALTPSVWACYPKTAEYVINSVVRGTYHTDMQDKLCF